MGIVKIESVSRIYLWLLNMDESIQAVVRPISWNMQILVKDNHMCGIFHPGYGNDYM